MKIVALLSWFDEQPEHLVRCVESCAQLADHVVAVDGCYAHFPDPRYASPARQAQVIARACRDSGLGLTLHTPAEQWAGEVAKRAFMFRLGLSIVRSRRDWFLIIDGDMALADVAPGARLALGTTDCDVAEVRWRDVRQDGHLTSDLGFRSLFRALPGLTVKHTHWLYTARGRWLWHTPNGHISPEPAADFTGAVTMHHFNLDRDDERAERARRYYQARDAANLEVPPG